MRLLSLFSVLKQHFVQEFDQNLLGGGGFLPEKPMIMPTFKPATLAALVQCAAFIVVMALAWLVYLMTPHKLPNVALVMMQALGAVTIAYYVGMAVWWRWIHIAFPLAIWGFSQVDVPTNVYFYGFIISLSLFWTTFRTQVPFYPSLPKVWHAVEQLIPQNKPIRMIDIGSGLGDLVMHIAKQRPESEITGIEIAPLPWLISKVRACFKRSSACFTFGDYHALNFADYDVIFAYLSPAAMQALWLKAQQEMRAGSMLMSYEFEIAGVKPSMKVLGHNGSPTLYVWKV